MFPVEANKLNAISIKCPYSQLLENSIFCNLYYTRHFFLTIDCMEFNIMCNRFPRFFLTIVVVQHVPLHTIDIATWCDVTLKSARMCSRNLRDICPGGAFWPKMTSRDPVGLPLENMQARIRDQECPWVCSLGRPRTIYRFLALSLVFCPFHRHFINTFNNDISYVCSFRTCSPSSLSRSRSQCGGNK